MPYDQLLLAILATVGLAPSPGKISTAEGVGVPVRLRPLVNDLDPYIAGRSEASLHRELGLAEIVKLGSNESPYGPFPAAVAAMSDVLATANRYPERDFELAEELAAHWQVSTDRIQLGNGVDPIIGWLSMACLDPGDQAVMPAPSFVSYALDAEKMGAEAVKVPLDHGRHDLARMVEAVTPRTRLLYVCSPNNPTGDIVDEESLAWLVDTVSEDVLIVVDQAYAEYVVDPAYGDVITRWASDRPNVAVLRTFSKLYGLANVRVGYCIADPAVVAALGRIRHYFDVSDLGHVGALASLRDQEEVARRRDLNVQVRARVEATLDEWGLPRMTSHANFVAFDVGDGQRVCDALMACGVITRALGAFGSGGLLRVSMGTDTQMDRFLDVLGDVLGRR